MNNLGASIRADRIAQGLSLQGLADRLNGDRSIDVDRKFTTSWLHHLENDRAKALSTAFKKGIARALCQDEGKYLDANESLDKRKQTFAKFFDEQMAGFEQGSTLICDFRVDRQEGKALGELLLCIYQFLVATEGKVVAFERSPHLALPVFLLAIRSCPSIDDMNLEQAVRDVIAPSVSGGFIRHAPSEPTKDALQWVTRGVEVYEMTADEQALALLVEDPMYYVGVVSPNLTGGEPMKRVFYYLSPYEYGQLNNHMAEVTFKRFAIYRDRGLFSRCDYADSFGFAFSKMGTHFHIDFGGVSSQMAS